MRRLVLACCLLALAVPGVADVRVGAPAPGFTLVDLEGTKHSLADHRGKVVVLEWINPSCPFSERHAAAGTTIELSRGDSSVVWLAINSTAPGHRDFLEPPEHAAYDAEHGIPYPVLYDRDGAVGKKYGAKTTPHMYVIDGDGRLVYAGAIDDDPYGRVDTPTNYVEEALRAVKRGAAPDPATTRPYGCSVKYGS